MPSIKSIEEQIMSEYGLVKGLIATHPYISVVVALAVGAAGMWVKLRLFG